MCVALQPVVSSSDPAASAAAAGGGGGVDHTTVSGGGGGVGGGDPMGVLLDSSQHSHAHTGGGGGGGGGDRKDAMQALQAAASQSHLQPQHMDMPMVRHHCALLPLLPLLPMCLIIPSPSPFPALVVFVVLVHSTARGTSLSRRLCTARI